MTESISDKQTWTRIGLTIGTLLLIMFLAIFVSLMIG